MMLLHLGYFNDVADLKRLCNSNPDEVVFNFMVGKGHFYKVDNEVYDFEDIEHLNPQFTLDKDYLIVYDIPCDDSILNMDNNDNTCDFFIDVYKVIDDDINVNINKVCKWLKEKDDMCCGELSMILGTNFIEDFKKEMIIKQ